MPQLQWSAHERELLGQRIQRVMFAALGDHQARMRQYAEDYKRFLAVVDPPKPGEEHKSNLKTPVIQSRVLSKCGYNFAAIFGEDAEITATPTEESDAQSSAKVAAFMNWRLFNAMGIQTDVQVSDFRRVLFGHTIVYRPWVRKTYWERQQADQLDPAKLGNRAIIQHKSGAVDVEQVEYEGPAWVPCWPDDIVWPSEDVKSIQDFSWVVRKVWVTPQELLDGERAGRYAGIEANWEAIMQHAMARSGKERSEPHQGMQQVKREADLFAGVTYDYATGEGRPILPLWEWYGRWREPVKGDCDEHDYTKRSRQETEIVAHYLPDAQMIVGLQDLRDLYPTMKNRRPFSEMRLVRSGPYEGMGLGRMLRALEDEQTANYNRYADASEWSVNPAVLARSNAGLNEKNAQLRPGMIHWVVDPSGVQRLDLKGDLGSIVVGRQMVEEMLESVDGQNALVSGRSADRPNQPKTLGGQQLLIEQGNMRLNFDTALLKLDIEAIVSDMWAMECSPLAPPEVFVRVTGEQPNGLIETQGGGFTMTSQERAGKYDFRIRFATSIASKMADKENFVALYDRAMQNPVVVTRVDVCGWFLQQLAKKLGFPDAAKMIPAPKVEEMPVSPAEEDNRMRQGERITVHPADHDDQHLIEHYASLGQHLKLPPERQDEDFVMRESLHIREHEQQKKTKMMMQAMVNSLGQMIQPAAEAGVLPVPGGGNLAGDGQGRTGNSTGPTAGVAGMGLGGQ